MNFANNQYEDENLSDELLSEGVASCKVRDSNRILQNMVKKSLNSKNTAVEQLFSFRPREVSRQLSKTNVKKIGKKSYKSKDTISCNQIEDLSKNPKEVINQPGKDELKTRSTLKSDISSLLRRVAQLKMKNQYLSPSPNLCAPRRPKDSDDSFFVTMKDIGAFQARRT
ncbi:unnamed protein product [Moneuplotes crassus]|uniref:Uncharacterized protein n=1 Tax=Euplotes crassus TaxID=5936 RepID=A0AAD1TZ33_EUPCR|nr:unnamed protein product [Moneuplotes crassus]